MNNQLFKRRSLATLAVLERHLASRSGLRVAEVTRELEVCRRTLDRYLDFVRFQLGVPLQYDRLARAWRYPPGTPRIFSDWVHQHCL